MESAELAEIQTEYGVPDELIEFVRKGVITVISKTPEEKTVTFDVPKLASIDHLQRHTYYQIIWIHPDFNAQFCHYYVETPGDVPNFMVTKETDDSGADDIDFETVDDLTSWLDDLED